MKTKQVSRTRNGWITTACDLGVWLLFWLALPAVSQAQFTYTINNGTITITGYTGTSAVVSIPASLDSLPVTSIGDRAFMSFTSLTGVTIPNTVSSIGPYAFANCYSLSGVTIPNSVTSLGDGAFEVCTSLTNFTVPSSVTTIPANLFVQCSSLITVSIGQGVTSIGLAAFDSCFNLTSVTIPNSVTTLGGWAFSDCHRLTSITIPNSVTNIGGQAFADCPILTSVWFEGNAPTVGASVFTGDNNASLYYLPWTTGWSAMFGGRPTALWLPPSIVAPPLTQTAEMESLASFSVEVANTLPETTYQWLFNGTNALGGATNSYLILTNVQPVQAGAYTVVATNPAGTVASDPALLSVIAPVAHRVVAALYVTGDLGSLLHLDYVNGLGAGAAWRSLASLTLTNTPQIWFDLSDPLPAQRFYRAWAAGTPPALNLGLATVITLTGTIGTSMRIDYINEFGPTNAWVTLDTVTLTNSPRLYFDTTMFGQPPRLYRLVPGQ